MNELNSFEDMKEKNNKPVFYSAVYHLGSSDKNCEILLFTEKTITESILRGFEKNEFKMYLQFIVDNKAKRIASDEALSRWDSPQKGLIGPAKYIANMETSEQNALVSSSECDFIQGWFYSKALPLEECETFIDMYEKKN